MENYKESGIIEAYCLGLLPENEAAAITLAAAGDSQLQQMILETEEALKQYSRVKGSDDLKGAILSKLLHTQPAAYIDIKNPPLIDRNSDSTDWNEAIAGIVPETDHGNIKTSFLVFTDELQVCIAWLSDKLEEEGHHEDEFEESFLILEGSCECNIGGSIFRLKAGDFLDIPFNSNHTITPTSANGFVKAIIQRKRTAA